MGLVHVDGCHGISEFLNIRPRPGQGQGAGPGEKGALWGKIVPSMTIATIASSPFKIMNSVYFHGLGRFGVFNIKGQGRSLGRGENELSAVKSPLEQLSQQ